MRLVDRIQIEHLWRPALLQFSVTFLLVAGLTVAPALGQATTDESTPVVDRMKSVEPAPGPSPPRRSTGSYELTEEQLANLRKLEVFTYVWFFVLGASAGSFLNVVIYRLPAGRRLVGRSMCPGCDQQIALRDNIPILGWLRLWGRCRECGVRISVRYPLVEAAIGGWFALLLAGELLSGGGNLPVRTPNMYAGVVWIIWYTKWDLIGIFFFHCFLGCVVFAAALIQWDGHPLPRRLTWFGLGTGVVAPVIWTHLHPVSFHEPRLNWLERSWRWQIEFVDPLSGWTQHFGVGLEGLLNGVAGVMAGVFVGKLIALCLGPSAFPKIPVGDEPEECTGNWARSDTSGFVTLFAIAGAFLGWQCLGPLAICVSTIALGFSVLSTLKREPRWCHQTTNTAIAAAVLIQIPLWRVFSGIDLIPDHSGWSVFATSEWWPLTSYEPYPSIALAIAVGCLIAMGHSLCAFVEAPQTASGETSLNDSDSLDAAAE